MLSDCIFLVVGLVLGGLIGFYTNAWFAVDFKKPKLVQKTILGRTHFQETNFLYWAAGIENELRLWNKNKIERVPARKCRAYLFDEHGKSFCSLYWRVNGKSLDEIDIKTGSPSWLLVFVINNENPVNFCIYQPTSPSDSTPKIEERLCFNKSTKFVARVFYSYDRTLSFPVEITKRNNEFSASFGKMRA